MRSTLFTHALRLRIVPLALLASLGGLGDAIEGSARAAEAKAPPPGATDSKTPGASASRPADLEEVARVIDLRTFPRPEGAAVEQSAIGSHVPGLGTIHLSVPGDMKKVVDFYSAKLAAAGWKDAPKADPRQPSRSISDDYAYLALAKQNFILILMISKEKDAKDDKVSVHIDNHGNVDTRALPRIAGAKEEPGQPHLSRYLTTESVAAVTDFTRKELASQGWQEINRLPYTQKDSDLLQFRKRAIALWINISNRADLNIGGRTAVNYSARVLSDELPTPPDARDVKLEDSSIDIEPLLEMSFTTPATMESVADFYRKELTARGWKFREGAGLMDKTKGFYYYDGAAEDEVRLDMKRPKDGPTEVTVRHVSADMVRREKEQFEKDKEKNRQNALKAEELRKKREAKMAEKRKEAEEKKKAAANSRPKDIPIPDDATDVVADDFFKSLTFNSKASRARLVGYYQDELKKRGWEAAVRSDPLVTGYMRYKKGEAEVMVNIDASKGKPSKVKLSTREVEWEIPPDKTP
jgi:hypothetical protein